MVVDQNGTRTIVTCRGTEFLWFDGNGSDTFFRDPSHPEADAATISSVSNILLDLSHAVSSVHLVRLIARDVECVA